MSVLNRLAKIARSPRINSFLKLFLWLVIVFFIVLLTVQVLPQQAVKQWLDDAIQSRITDGVRLFIEVQIVYFWPHIVKIGHLKGIKEHLQVRLPIFVIVAIVEFAVQVAS